MKPSTAIAISKIRVAMQIDPIVLVNEKRTDPEIPLSFERQYPREAAVMMNLFRAGFFIHCFINLRGGCNPFEVFNYREVLNLRRS